MAWSTVRKATSEDVARWEAARARFIQRHGVDPDDLTTYDQGEIEAMQTRYLMRLWRRACWRAVGTYDGISYGYVGVSV